MMISGQKAHHLFDTGDSTIHSYMGIMINHEKDPYQNSYIIINHDLSIPKK